MLLLFLQRGISEWESELIETLNLTSKSLKNKCVSAKLKIISSMRSPNDTEFGASWGMKVQQHIVRTQGFKGVVIMHSRSMAALWLACSTPNWEVWVQVLAGSIVLCSWTTHFWVPISSKFLFSYLILYLTQWTSAKEKFDLAKMQSFLEVLKTFKFAAILVHHSHQSSHLNELWRRLRNTWLDLSRLFYLCKFNLIVHTTCCKGAFCMDHEAKFTEVKQAR